jgi:O-antigen/teichoic acid export membrane protein
VIGMLLLAAAIGGAAQSVLEIFGPGFDRAVPALVLLALFPALASISVTQTQALWAVDRPGITSLIAFVRLGVAIVLLVALTPSMNMVGPALALLAGFVVAIVLSGLVLRGHLTRPLRASWPLREMLTLPIAYGAGFTATHGIEKMLPTTFAVPLCLAAGALVYGVAFVACGGLNERDRARLGEVVAMLRARLGRAEESTALVQVHGEELYVGPGKGSQ